MKQYSIFDIKKLFGSFCNAIRGIKLAFMSEVALRQQIIIGIILFPLALLLGKNSIEKIFLISSWLLVIIIELVNTAIETIVDRIGFDHHYLSQKAKDTGSAAVLIAVINAIFIWLIIIL